MRTRWDLMPRRVKRPGMLAGGDGSTLSLDFTAMSGLDSRFTFSRSSTATVINSSGLVQWTNANIVRRSEDCTNWGGAQNILPTADAAIAPNGTQTADQLNLLSTSYRYQQTAANKVIGGQRYTGSIYVRAVSGTVQVNLRIANAADGNNGVAVTQTVGETWTRLQGSFTLASNGTLIDIGLDQRTGIPNAGPGVAANVYVWGLQLQPGGTAGEYLQTTTTENYNTPRFDYDPTTLAPSGLLIEGSATNELLRSNAFNTSPWFVSSFTTPSIASPAVTDPAGGTDTWYGVPSGAGLVYHGFRYTFTFTAATYTFSIWAKAAQHDKFIISDLTTGTGACQFDLTAKTATVITGSVTPTNPQIVQYPNGWFRCSFTMQMSAITTGMCWSSYPTGATTTRYGAQFTATGTDGMYFYGAQLEIGSGATSYIPTGSSTVQRAADSCSMTGTNFSSWYPAGTTSGTFFCQFDNSRSNLGFAINPTPIALGEYSAGNLIAGLMNTTVVGSGATISVWGSGGSGLQQAAIGATISQGNKIAFAFNGQTATGSLNGGSGTATTTGTVNSKTILFIGGSGSGSSLVRDYIGAPIQRIKFFPSVFSTAQLQSLTQ